MIKWILIDVGNVIFNDDPAMAMIYKKLYNTAIELNQEVSFGRLLMERENLIITKNDGKHYGTLAKKYLGKGGWKKLRQDFIDELEENYTKYNPPMEGIDEVIKELSTNYNLAIAANQTKACRGALEDFGLIQYFDVIGISAEMGLGKPAPDFYKTILSKAECKPEEAIMIGDRIDNDILPANRLGMRTVWVYLDIDLKAYTPADDLEKMYFESMKRANTSRTKPRNEQEEPDVTVTSIEEISKAVEQIEKMNMVL